MLLAHLQTELFAEFKTTSDYLQWHGGLSFLMIEFNGLAAGLDNGVSWTTLFMWVHKKSRRAIQPCLSLQYYVWAYFLNNRKYRLRLQEKNQRTIMVFFALSGNHA